MKETIFNDWLIISDDFYFKLLSDTDEVIIREDNYERNVLFDGKITKNNLSIYEMFPFVATIEINYINKIIKLVKTKHMDF